MLDKTYKMIMTDPCN